MLLTKCERIVGGQWMVGPPQQIKKAFIAADGASHGSRPRCSTATQEMCRPIPLVTTATDIGVGREWEGQVPAVGHYNIYLVRRGGGKGTGGVEADPLLGPPPSGKEENTLGRGEGGSLAKHGSTFDYNAME